MGGEGFELPTYSINNSEHGRVIVNEEGDVNTWCDLVN
jgi:hypothetical protein